MTGMKEKRIVEEKGARKPDDESTRFMKDLHTWGQIRPGRLKKVTAAGIYLHHVQVRAGQSRS